MCWWADKQAGRQSSGRVGRWADKRAGTQRGQWKSGCVGRQAGHMLQMTEDAAESILFGCHTTLSSSSATALVSVPVLSQVGSISAPEDTAEYKTEQHNEVTF